MSTSTTSPERRKRRRTAVRLGIAGLALLGIGAAATSAAWTDDAWFNASAGSATIELQGSLDGQTWSDADNAAAQITIPASTFADLGQGDSKTVDIQIKNDSTVAVDVAEAVDATGAIFESSQAPLNDPATVSTNFTAGSLAAGATETITVTVTTPNSWSDDYQGKTGAITLTYTGTQA